MIKPNYGEYISNMEQENKQADFQPLSVQTPVAQSTKNKKVRVVALILGCLLLVASFGFGGYQLGAQKSQSAKDSQQPQTSTQAVETDDSKSEESAVTSPTVKDQDTIYNPSIGRYTLKLPSKYVVVVNHDGGGEGGTSTLIEIAESTKTSGVVKGAFYDQVTLNTYFLMSDGDFRSNVDAEVKELQAEKQASIKIDGLDAEVYAYIGLGSPKNVYFAKNGMYYKITMKDTSEAANAKLEAIVSGLKFDL